MSLSMLAQEAGRSARTAPKAWPVGTVDSTPMMAKPDPRPDPDRAGSAGRAGPVLERQAGAGDLRLRRHALRAPDGPLGGCHPAPGPAGPAFACLDRWRPRRAAVGSDRDGPVGAGASGRCGLPRQPGPGAWSSGSRPAGSVAGGGAASRSRAGVADGAPAGPRGPAIRARSMARRRGQGASGDLPLSERTRRRRRGRARDACGGRPGPPR